MAEAREAWREGFDLAVNMMEIAAEFQHGGSKTIGGNALVRAAGAIARNRDDAERQAEKNGLFEGDELVEEFIVTGAAGYPDAFRPTPNTLEEARRFAADHDTNASTGEKVAPAVYARSRSEWSLVPSGDQDAPDE